MGTKIEIEFEQDIPEERLAVIRDKISLAINGEAVPADEVVGQSAGRFNMRWGGGEPRPPKPPRDPRPMP